MKRQCLNRHSQSLHYYYLNMNHEMLDLLFLLQFVSLLLLYIDNYYKKKHNHSSLLIHRHDHLLLY